MSQPYRSVPDTSPRKTADKGGLVERLRSNEPLPACPFDRISPLYLTMPDDRPCPFCGQENTLEGPDKCRGADTRIFGEAANEIAALRAQLASARKALDGAAEYLQKHAARRTIMLSQTSWRPKRSTVEADRNAMVSVENTLRAALKDLPK